MLLSWYEPGIYGSGSPKVQKGFIGVIYLRGLASFSMVNVVVLWYESWIYVVGPLKYTKALYMDHIFLGTCIIFLWLMVDIYYEKDLTFIEFCFSWKGVKWHFMGWAP
jgi:hypothetical protein